MKTNYRYLRAGFLVATGVTACTAFPIGATALHNIAITPYNVLSNIPKHIIDQATLNYGLMMGLGLLATVMFVIGSITFSFVQDKIPPSIILSSYIGAVAFSGMVTCAFLLDTINNIRNYQNLHNTFTIIISHNKSGLQTLIDSEFALIAGVVICTTVIAGLIGFCVYTIEKGTG